MQEILFSSFLQRVSKRVLSIFFLKLKKNELHNSYFYVFLYTEKQNNSMLWTKTESEWVIFTFSSSIEQIKWIVCKTSEGAEADTDLPGPALRLSDLTAGRAVPGGCWGSNVLSWCSRASWDLQGSIMWLNRYLASNGWLSRCRHMASRGQGAVTGSRLSEGKE